MALGFCDVRGCDKQSVFYIVKENDNGTRTSYNLCNDCNNYFHNPKAPQPGDTLRAMGKYG